MIDKIVSFINASKRIFAVSKKPDWDEYKVMLKITGIGIILVAVIGFIITLIFIFFNLGK